MLPPIEHINLHSSQPLAYEVARLIRTEIYEDEADDLKEEIAFYLNGIDTSTTTHYVINSQASGLLAVAAVLHKVEQPRNPITIIRDLAVRPDQQRQGHGTRLIRHTASKALEHNDAAIHLIPLDTNEEYYTRLGFVAGNGVDMRADPRQLISRSC